MANICDIVVIKETRIKYADGEFIHCSVVMKDGRTWFRYANTEEILYNTLEYDNFKKNFEELLKNLGIEYTFEISKYNNIHRGSYRMKNDGFDKLDTFFKLSFPREIEK